MAELCELGHRHLAARTDAWEKAAAEGQGKRDDAFWHATNTLWHASREYSRRHHSCDALTTKVSAARPTHSARSRSSMNSKRPRFSR